MSEKRDPNSKDAKSLGIFKGPPVRQILRSIILVVLFAEMSFGVFSWVFPPPSKSDCHDGTLFWGHPRGEDPNLPYGKFPTKFHRLRYTEVGYLLP